MTKIFSNQQSGRSKFETEYAEEIGEIVNEFSNDPEQKDILLHNASVVMGFDFKEFLGEDTKEVNPEKTTEIKNKEGDLESKSIITNSALNKEFNHVIQENLLPEDGNTIIKEINPEKTTEIKNKEGDLESKSVITNSALNKEFNHVIQENLLPEDGNNIIKEVSPEKTYDLEQVKKAKLPSIGQVSFSNQAVEAGRIQEKQELPDIETVKNTLNSLKKIKIPLPENFSELDIEMQKKVLIAGHFGCEYSKIQPIEKASIDLRVSCLNKSKSSLYLGNSPVALTAGIVDFIEEQDGIGIKKNAPKKPLGPDLADLINNYLNKEELNKITRESDNPIVAAIAAAKQSKLKAIGAHNRVSAGSMNNKNNDEGFISRLIKNNPQKLPTRAINDPNTQGPPEGSKYGPSQETMSAGDALRKAMQNEQDNQSSYNLAQQKRNKRKKRLIWWLSAIAAGGLVVSTGDDGQKQPPPGIDPSGVISTSGVATS